MARLRCAWAWDIWLILEGRFMSTKSQCLKGYEDMGAVASSGVLWRGVYEE